MTTPTTYPTDLLDVIRAGFPRLGTPEGRAGCRILAEAGLELRTAALLSEWAAYQAGERDTNTGINVRVLARGLSINYLPGEELEAPLIEADFTYNAPRSRQ